MKKSNSISVIMLIVLLAGCGGDKQTADDIITVDVTASYPKKELILQDFMDVEYIPLETSDEFITQGLVKAVGKDIIIVRNRRDGDIFVFDRTGRGIRKINRLGQGSEEYSQIGELILDEDNNELFVVDYPARKTAVYDLYGNFKRGFKFSGDSRYNFTFNYDRNHLMSYKNDLGIVHESSYHVLISKQDGSITQEIQVPFKEMKTPVLRKDELTVMPAFYLTFPYLGDWALVNTSSDTIYTYLADGTIHPFIARTPSIQVMEPEVFLFPSVLTDRYYFMYTQKKEVDFTTMKGFPITDLVYDRQAKALFQYTVYNEDFSNKEEVSLNLEPLNHEIPICKSLEAPDLVEAYKEGRLKGRLKEIAAELDEESNPVIMLIKNKI